MKKKPLKQKSVTAFNSMNCHDQSEAYFTSFCNDPQNNHYFCGQPQICPARAVIFRQDTPAEAVYVIEQGLVKLVRVISSGRQVIVGFRHRDWLIGAPAIFLDKQYSYTAITVLPTSLRSIPKKIFLELVKKNDQFSLRVHRLLSQNIFSQMKKMEETSYMSAQERLEFFLSDIIANKEAMVSKAPDNFALPLTNQELAQLLAISPEHLCRVLKGMEEKGLLRRANGTVIVTNPSGIPQK
jgi:CRP-like cAMP-binding protein